MHASYDNDPDAPIHRAWGTVHAPGAAGAGLGAGLIVAEGFLLTCAHVVNAALGRPKLAAAEPSAQDMLRVSVSFPGLGSEHHAVELVRWLAPEPAKGEQWWNGDLALLKVEMEGWDVPPVPVRETSSRRLSTWYAHGAPRSLVDVYVQTSMGPWYILDPGHAPLEILPGHSGAPLWDRESGCVTGLMVSTEPDNLRSYAIRASELVKLLADASVFPSAMTEVSDPRTRARRSELIDALDQLSDRKLQRCAERFAGVLGLPWAPGSCSGLVDAAMRHPRGLATLLSTLTAQGPVAKRVGEVAAMLGALRLFTQEEFDELCALLGPDAYSEVRAAARRAVPHFSLSEAGPPDVGELVEDLEDRASEPGIVPPVIQVIEEVAAARQAGGVGLREWSDRVTARLGVRPEAMRQCRWSATSRASARTLSPVLRVWLWAAEPAAEAFHYVMRLYDAHGQQVRTWTDGDALRSRADLCAALSEAVDDLDQYEESAGVEFLLEEGFFGLAVDRLPTNAGPLGTRPIGLDRVVVLRGQKGMRAGDWRRRWEQGQSSAAGPYVLHDLNAANGTLTSNREIACVIACCPPGQHDSTLALCRWLGVPVVLWQRGAHGLDTAEALRDVVSEDWPRTLRESVRGQRVQAMFDTAHMGAHLALMWEDPGWSPPRQRLTSPSKREGGAA
ncbi:trypsin-like peptidase domain-containing protein [Streptomyces sp. NPDC050164]|uniref:VMAP-C domain-containing protein n=1 Tax=Streptomyces sp. NPDC050164 TaxID=3365605 RepID=UPI0037AFD8AE